MLTHQGFARYGSYLYKSVFGHTLMTAKKLKRSKLKAYLSIAFVLCALLIYTDFILKPYSSAVS
jgi:hypothetical protein